MGRKFLDLIILDHPIATIFSRSKKIVKNSKNVKLGFLWDFDIEIILSGLDQSYLV
jgi:hypothetical protein